MDTKNLLYYQIGFICGGFIVALIMQSGEDVGIYPAGWALIFGIVWIMGLFGVWFFDKITKG